MSVCLFVNRSVFAFPTSGLEFAYSQSPVDLRGVVMGLNLAMIGFGYYFASVLASIVKSASQGDWYPQDLNDGRLENYMFLLAGLMLLNFVIFVILAQRYQYASHQGEVIGENDGV